MMKKFSHIFRKEEPKLDPAIANQMLSNILESGDYSQNTIPLEVLTSYSNYRKERHLLQKFLLVVALICFFLLPIFFVAPNYDLIQKEGDSPGKPTVAFMVKNWIPTDTITAYLDDTQIPVYETQEGTYYVVPDKNGTLTVTVKLLNGQYSTRTLKLTNVDTEIPVLARSERADDYLVIYFTDNSGTLDFEGIYAVSPGGETSYPVSYDAKSMSVTFEYPAENLNYFIPDPSGNILQLIVTLY